MRDFIGLFGLSSAICCHLISTSHFDVKESWYANKWFWAGFFGNLPALIGFLAHIHFSKTAQG